MSRTRLTTNIALVGLIVSSAILLIAMPVSAKQIPQAPRKEVTATITGIMTALAQLANTQASGGYWVTATKYPSQLSTLFGISQSVYGKASNWQGICNANKLSNCDRIDVGQKLYAPQATALNNTRTAPERASRSNTTTTTSSGWVHPLASGQRGGSCYGWRSSTSSFHRGVDMAQPFGTAIRAAAAGTIHRKSYDAGGAGYYVVVNHGNNVFTVYMHMPGHSPLSVGTHVNAGQQIGRVGSTGHSTGNHLHFEVHQGLWNQINPAPFMRARGVNIGC